MQTVLNVTGYNANALMYLPKQSAYDKKTCYQVKHKQSLRNITFNNVIKNINK